MCRYNLPFDSATSSFNLSAIKSRSISAASNPSGSICSLILSKYLSANLNLLSAAVSFSSSELDISAFSSVSSTDEPDSLPDISSSSCLPLMTFVPFAVLCSDEKFLFLDGFLTVPSVRFRFFCDVGVVKNEDIFYHTSYLRNFRLQNRPTQ